MFVAFLLCAALADRQPDPPLAPSGEIRIEVVDVDGKPIPGVTVTPRKDQSDRAPWMPLPAPLITDAAGSAVFSNLHGGEYLVECAMSGYITTTIGPLPISYARNAPQLPATMRVVMNGLLIHGQEILVPQRGSRRISHVVEYVGTPTRY